MMENVGSLLIIALLMAHFFLIALLIAPADKLLGLIIHSEEGFLRAEQLPVNVEHFLVINRVPVNGDYQAVNSRKAELIFSILKFRREHFMNQAEKMVLDMNLLNYDADIIGLKAGGRLYYSKSTEQLTDKEWITLVHLQRIISKK